MIATIHCYPSSCAEENRFYTSSNVTPQELREMLCGLAMQGYKQFVIDGVPTSVVEEASKLL